MICQKARICPVILSKLRIFSVTDWNSKGTYLKQFSYRCKQESFNRTLPKARCFSAMAGPPSMRHTNRLAHEKSPYLLQHAHNPVDWYPWGQEAFSKAQTESKLIFLSVGYSTCHWCHVMERESFENEDIAKIMNEHFVCVKVDREERPDVDKLYMTFVQAVSGRGGWPMSVWLKPDLVPVAGGTYYPPRDQFGRPGFPTMLLTVSKKWRENRSKFAETGEKVMEVLREASILDNAALEPSAAEPPGAASWEKCFQQLSRSFEPRFGGFGSAPKFPQPVNMDFLLHLHAKEPRSGDGQRALEMVSHTLAMMSKGGIHDHVSQGFARYSTDDKWHVPHFEKMLYDQGQLAVVFANAFVASKNNLFADMVHDILKYVNRDLSHPAGGFYSAEDADSLPTADSKDKKEGAFCVWTFDEIKSALTQPVSERPGLTVAEVFSYHFDVKPEGNVNPHQDPHNELKNKNVLIVYGSEEKTAQKFELTVERVNSLLCDAKRVLFELRGKRPRPHLDDKMLTAWNGLMISGCAKAGQCLGSQSYIQRAIGAAKFVREHLYDADRKTLLRSCYKSLDGGVAQIGVPIGGFLDDYAFLIRGLLDLYEACFDAIWIEWAETLQDTQDRLFWDEGGAGYYTSPADDPSIVIRMKEDQDGAEPSGNSVAVHNLLRLSALLDAPAHKARAGRILAAFTSRLTRAPLAVPEMVSGLMLFHDGPTQIFITGRKEDPDTAGLLDVVQSLVIPGRVLVLADGDEDSVVYRKCEVVRRMKPVNGHAAAYVCRHHTCSLPVTTREELAKLLDKDE